MDKQEKFAQEEVNGLLFNMLEMTTVESIFVGLADAIEKREMYCRQNWPDQPETFAHLTQNLMTVRECLAKLSDLGKQRAEDAKIEREILLEQTKAERANQDAIWKEKEDAIVKPLLEQFVTVVAGRQFTIEKPTDEDGKEKVSLDGVEIVGEERETLDKLYHELSHYENRDDVLDVFIACGLRKPRPVKMVPPPPLADSVTIMMETIRGLTKMGATQDEIDKLLEVYALKGFDGEEDAKDANFERIALKKLDWLRSERVMGREP